MMISLKIFFLLLIFKINIFLLNITHISIINAIPFLIFSIIMLTITSFIFNKHLSIRFFTNYIVIASIFPTIFFNYEIFQKGNNLLYLYDYLYSKNIARKYIERKISQKEYHYYDWYFSHRVLFKTDYFKQTHNQILEDHKIK